MEISTQENVMDSKRKHHLKMVSHLKVSTKKNNNVIIRAQAVWHVDEKETLKGLHLDFK